MAQFIKGRGIVLSHDDKETLRGREPIFKNIDAFVDWLCRPSEHFLNSDKEREDEDNANYFYSLTN